MKKPPSPFRPFAGRAAAVLLGLSAFLASTAGLRSLVPWPGDYGLGEKFAFFEAHKDEFNLLFFGSSVIYRAVVPRVVEEELLRRGTEVRSFNFGCPGMRAFEADYLLKKALAEKPARLRWVVVEARDWEPGIFPAHAFTRRAAYWHDTEETLLALESVRLARAPIAEKARMACEHLLHWAWNMTAYGRGPEIVSSLLGGGKREGRAAAAAGGTGPGPQPAAAAGGTGSGPQPAAAAGGTGSGPQPGGFPAAGGGAETDVTRADLERDRGYRALEDERAPEFLARRETFLKNLDRYERLLSRLKAPGAAGTASYNLTALTRQKAAIRTAGAKAIYVVPPGPPGLVTAAAVKALHAEGFIPRLLVYNDPAGYPAFYAVGNHYDSNHLSRKGALLFSRTLARDLAGFLRGGEGKGETK